MRKPTAVPGMSRFHYFKIVETVGRELDVPIICLSQVGRQADGIEPKLADLRDSGSIEQDADVVILLHRDTTKNRTDDEEQRENPTSRKRR